MKKRIISCALGIFLLATVSFVTVAEREEKIKVEMDGQIIDFDVEAQIMDGSTMVPLRKIFEEIGALVKWDGETGTVTARKGAKTVTLTVDSSELTIDKGKTDENGNAVTERVGLEAPARIVSGRTLVPVRAVSEAFGLNVSWDGESKTVIIEDEEEDDSWKENTGTIDLSNMTFEGEGIDVSGNRIMVTEGGDFTLTGALKDGGITVSTKDKVKLRLSGVEISASEGSCIYIEEADKAYITITEGTKNTLTAKGSDAAIYSEDKLEIKGKGSLTVTAEDGHGIKVSDNLTIENGNISISASGDGIHVKDTFKMTGGTADIKSVGDGIDSDSIVIVSGGELDIKTDGVPVASSTDNTDMNMPRGGGERQAEVEFEKSTKGIKAEWMMSISGGEITINAASHAVHCQDEIEITGGRLTLSSEYEKGISAHGNLTISGSETVITVEKSTEGLESKNTLTVNDGVITISASDDGINATGGKSGEQGPGGQGNAPKAGGGKPFEERGNASLQKDNPFGGAKDRRERPDGMKDPMQAPGQGGADKPAKSREAAGDTARPKDEPGMNGAFDPFGGQGGGSEADCLVINGGDIEIYAEDDCIDSNGNLIINGGTIKAVKVNGSFTGPNSMLDADGTVEINEGVTLIAAGSGGTQGKMNIAQGYVTVYCEEEHSSGDGITLKNEKGKVIAEYTPRGSYSAVLVTAPELEKGKVYTVTVGDEVHEVTVSEGMSPEMRKNEGFGGPRGMR